MASTGDVFPTSGTTVDRAGSTAWTSPGNITANDAADASAAVPTDYLIASGFGFSIPTGSTIKGVTVKVEASETGTGSSNYIPQLSSDTTPTLIGSAKSAVTVNGTTPTVSTNGGTSDLWGATLTPATVNAAGFGVTLWSTDTTNTLSIDYVTIAIEYDPPPADDGDVSWWSGDAPRSGAAVAIASAAAALSLSVAIAGGFNVNEEIIPQSAGTPLTAESASPPPTQRLRHETSYQRWWAQDEFPSAPMTIVETDGWEAPRIAPAPAPLVFSADEDLPVAAAPSVALDDSGWVPEARVVQPFVKVWEVEDEKVIAATPLGVELDYWLRLEHGYRQTVSGVLWATDDEIVPQPDKGGMGLPFYGQRLQHQTGFRHWHQGDELPIAPTFAPEDDAWQAPIVVQPKAVILPTWHQDEVTAQPAAAPFEDAWQQPTVWMPAAVTQVWSAQDEVVVQPAALPFEDYWHTLPWITPQPIARVWQQQDEVEQAASPLAVDIDEWVRPRIQADTLTIVWTDQDEIARISVDEVYWQQPPIIPVPPARQAVSADDEIVPQPAPLRVTDDEYRPPNPPTPGAFWQTWVDGDFVPPPATAIPFEDYWQQPYSVTVAPIAVWWTQQDERFTPPTPLPVDIDFMPLELRKREASPDLRVFADDGNFVPRPPVVYSAPPIGHRGQGTKRPRNAQTTSRLPPLTGKR